MDCSLPQGLKSPLPSILLTANIFTHPCIHTIFPVIHPSIRASKYPFKHSSIDLSIHPFKYPSKHSSVCPFIYPFIHLSIHSCIHLLVHLSTYTPIINVLNSFQLPGIVLDIVVTYHWITYGSQFQAIYIQETQTNKWTDVFNLAWYGWDMVECVWESKEGHKT